MEAFESFEHAGFTIELHTDEDPPAPSDSDQLGTLVAFDPLWREYRFAERNSTGMEDDCVDRGGLHLLARYLRMTQGAMIVPFTFDDYGSGGNSLRATDLDSDRAAGFIMTTEACGRELMGECPDCFGSGDSGGMMCARCMGTGWFVPDNREWYSEPHAWILHALRGELREWGAYVSGEVVGYVVKDERGEVVSSCWGFYPDGNGDGLEYVRETAREDARLAGDERARRALETRRGWALAHGQRAA